MSQKWKIGDEVINKRQNVIETVVKLKYHLDEMIEGVFYNAPWKDSTKQFIKISNGFSRVIWEVFRIN